MEELRGEPGLEKADPDNAGGLSGTQDVVEVAVDGGRGAALDTRRVSAGHLKSFSNDSDWWWALWRQVSGGD